MLLDLRELVRATRLSEHGLPFETSLADFQDDIGVSLRVAIRIRGLSIRVAIRVVGVSTRVAVRVATRT